MRTFTTIALHTCFMLSNCVTIHRYEEVDIISKKRIELPSLQISAALNHIAVMSAPVIPNALYYLYNPNGEARKLNIGKPTYPIPTDIINDPYDSIVIRYSDNVKCIIPVHNYIIFNLNEDEKSDATFEDYTNKMFANDFVIGPLQEEDHGNWVLSAYTREKNGDWSEIYKVITIEMKEYIPPKPFMANLREGETFEFSFSHPIPNLTSCELSAPRSAFDRLYDRDRINMDSCGFLIPNITKQDQGYWRIIGVGKIVYGTQVFVNVLDNNSTLFND